MTLSRKILRQSLLQTVRPEEDRALAHDALVQIANHILDMVEKEGRDLTIWEKANLAEAISTLGFGWLYLAWTDLDLALADPAEVSENAISEKHALALADFDIPRFRNALAHIASGPIRQL